MVKSPQPGNLHANVLRMQVAAVLALGADGAVLGTRLAATPESTIADAKKVRQSSSGLQASGYPCCAHAFALKRTGCSRCTFS